MDRIQFMRQLERLLWDIPESERLDAIAYYNDYFDEAGPENETQVIRELGSPEKVAANIKADLNISQSDEKRYDAYQYENKDLPAERKQRRNVPSIWVIILVVLASPILVGLAGGLFGAVVGILGGLLGVLVAAIVCGVALLVSGIVCFVVGIVRVIFNPLEGLITMGVGSFLLTLGILILVLMVWLIIRWLPALVRGVVNLFQRIFHIGERRNLV